MSAHVRLMISRGTKKTPSQDPRLLVSGPPIVCIAEHKLADTGGMDLSTNFMDAAQSAEDGALGILRACADPAAEAGDFYGPEGWTGFPGKLPPEDLLRDPENIRLNWEGCEAAVGAFTV